MLILLIAIFWTACPKTYAWIMILQNTIKAENFATKNLISVTENELINVFHKSKQSSTGIDNLSISYLKLCMPFVISYLINITNSILLVGNFPLSGNML